MPVPTQQTTRFLVFCHSAAKRRNLLSCVGTAVILLAITTAVPSHAQPSSCGGLTSIKETSELTYPPIARAAHVQGDVILLATFDQNGAVVQTKKITGAEMLEHAATSYVKGWQANTYSGPRECPIVITFRLKGLIGECANDLLAEIPSRQRPDLQHSMLTLRDSCVTTIHDIAGKKIHRFYFW